MQTTLCATLVLLRSLQIFTLRIDGTLANYFPVNTLWISSVASVSNNFIVL